MINVRLFGGKRYALTDDRGSLVVAPNNRDLDRAAGRVPNESTFHRFGYNPTVPNGSFADVWSYGPTVPTYNWLTAPDELRIASGGNVNDTAAGTGARSVVVLYLDENFDLKSEVLVTAGASASATTARKACRFMRAYVLDSGAYGGANAGDILIETEAGTVVGHILATYGQTEMSMFTVPNGHTAHLRQLNFTVHTGTNKDADVVLWQRRGADVVSAPFVSPRIVGHWVGVPAEVARPFLENTPYPAKTDIWVSAKGNNTTTAISVDIDFLLERT